MKKSYLIFEADLPLYHLNLIRQGIREYIESNDTRFQYSPLSWNELKLIHSTYDAEIGVIGWLRGRSTIEQLEARGIPYLNLCESRRPSNVGLELAFAGEGTFAADFFIETMGFENLAFVGLNRTTSSERRYDEFRRRAQRLGVSVSNYELENQVIIGSEVKESQFISIPGDGLIELIREIPKPAGIFCSNDRIALSVQHIATVMGYGVPEEISVIGVGGLSTMNNESLNGISIIQLDHLKQGKTGASMIVNHLLGKVQQKRQQLIPDGITHRETTINRNVADRLIQKVMTMIREDPALCVDMICERFGLSRRTLEKRFRTATNTTIARAIDYERFNKAKMLIKSVGYNQESIAGLSGYGSREQMRRSFYRFARMNPREYRQQCMTENGVVHAGEKY